jgi:hypothetical protein
MSAFPTDARDAGRDGEMRYEKLSMTRNNSATQPLSLDACDVKWS